MASNQQENSSNVPADPVSANDGRDGDACYHRHTSEAGERDEGSCRADDESESSDDEEYEMSLAELMYGASSFHAIAKPVSLTMILAASAAVFINTEESLMVGEKQLAAAYQVWKVDDSEGGAGTGTTLARSLGNAVVMVSVLCVMTFVIVILYKYRFMKCLIGYMIFTSAMLLGLMGSVMFDIAIDKYHIPIDVISYYFVLWNFAAVGTVAIFWQIGVPSFVTQGYLVATSVILAWHLSHFDEWTAWTLLVMLALYDLCAVLTPCGPLKALVNAMQEEDAPEMPGLLYEAQLEGGPAGTRPTGGRSANSSGSRRNSVGSGAEGTSSDNRNVSQPGGQPEHAALSYSAPSAESEATQTACKSESIDNPGQTSDPDSCQPVVTVPFAVAKIYRLPLVAPPSTLIHGSDTRASLGGSKRYKVRNGSNVDPSSLLSEGHEDRQPQQFSYDGNYTPQQLRLEVQAQLPRNGGRIEQGTNENGEPTYSVFDRNDQLKRVLFVNREGKVFEVVGDDDSCDDSDGEHAGKFSNSIRLGLGDFIFYSVMVAKAAMYSFTTFAACMLVILAGLGVTLVLLAVYHHALPALPVSIFLGVLFYLLTRLSIEPWVQDIMRVPLYV